MVLLMEEGDGLELEEGAVSAMGVREIVMRRVRDVIMARDIGLSFREFLIKDCQWVLGVFLACIYVTRMRWLSVQKKDGSFTVGLRKEGIEKP